MIEYWCAVAVAEELHFTRAAARLHIDQSALSRHIQKLEAALGLKLFIRGERKVELTNAGEAFIPFAKKALLAAKAGAQIALAVSRGEPQEFEIGYSTLVDTHLIAQVKALVEAARPRLPVRFRSVPYDHLITRLFKGSSHAAIGLLPVEEEVAETCVLCEELFLVVPRGHPFAHEPVVSIGQIGESGLIWLPGILPPAVTKDLFDRFRKGGYIPNVTHEAQSVAEALGLVRERLGITFVKTSDRTLAADGLKVLPLATSIPVETGLLYVRERRWDFLEELITLITNRFHCEGRSVENARV